MLKLDLGSGNNVKPGFEGVDISAEKAKWKMDLIYDAPWPWQYNEVDELYSSHFIEHIPQGVMGVYNDDSKNKNYFFHFFDECYRIIKPNGLFTVIWPALQSVRAFQDPTHTRYIPVETMFYLSKKWRKENGLDHYNVECDWILEGAPNVIVNGETLRFTQERMHHSFLWNVQSDVQCTLKAVKEVCQVVK